MRSQLSRTVEAFVASKCPRRVLDSYTHCKARLSSSRPSVEVKSKLPINEMIGPPTSIRSSGEDAGTSLGESLGPGLDLIRQDIEVGGKPFSLIIPQSSDAVCDFYINSGRLDRDPYWCRPWPSAIALAELLMQRPDLVRQKSVCEVGAGLGIAGIAAANAGAQSVILTDREELALNCALRTAEANQIPVSRNSKLETAHNGGKGVKARHLDWSSVDPGVGRFDVVLACDVIYELAAVEAIANLLPQLLQENTGRFILADPEARAPKHRQEIVDRLLTNSRFPMLLELAESRMISMDGISTKVEVLVFACNPGNNTIGIKQY